MGRKVKLASDKVCKCPKCDEAVDPNSKGIQCDLCHCWFHTTCVGLNDAQYSVLALLDQLFLCPMCLPVGKKLLTVEQKVSTLENCFDSLEASIKEQLDSLAKQVTQSQAPRFTAPNFAAPNFAPMRPPRMADIDINKVVVSAVKDALEADSKKTTVVLENFVPIGDDSSLEDDVKQYVTTAGFDPKKIVGIRRSGPEVKSYKDGTTLPRIIKVKCDSESSRAELIQLATKYADKGRKSKIYARPDRTWQQREALRRLNADLKEKRDAGEENWFIDRNSSL